MNGAPASVTIRAGARLNLGMVKTGVKPDRYITAGLCLQTPACKVIITPSSRMSVSGFDKQRTRFAIKKTREILAIKTGFNVCMAQHIPPHAGFGSGTRHSICVALAIAKMVGARFPIKRLAQALGRGSRSMVGVELVARGGCAVDTGDGIARISVPSAWRVLLITPGRPPSTRHYGQAEDSMMASIPPCSRWVKNRLYGHALEMARGVRENDFSLFEKSVEYFQRHAGRQFEELQGGGASTPEGRDILAILAGYGVRAMGQTSWGATLFAISPTRGAAKVLMKKLERETNHAVRMEIVKIPNIGHDAKSLACN